MAFKGLPGGEEAKGDGEAAEAGKEPGTVSRLQSWRDLRDKQPECFGDVKVHCHWSAAGTILQKSFGGP